MKYSGLVGGFVAVFALGTIVCATYPGDIFNVKVEKVIHIAAAVFAILLCLSIPIAAFLTQNDL